MLSAVGTKREELGMNSARGAQRHQHETVCASHHDKAVATRTDHEPLASVLQKATKVVDWWVSWLLARQSQMLQYVTVVAGNSRNTVLMPRRCVLLFQASRE